MSEGYFMGSRELTPEDIERRRDSYPDSIELVDKSTSLPFEEMRLKLDESAKRKVLFEEAAPGFIWYHGLKYIKLRLYQNCGVAGVNAVTLEGPGIGEPVKFGDNKIVEVEK